MTTTAVTTAVGNYADSVWYAVLDSAGYMDSNNGTAPSAGSQDGHPMLQLVGVQDFPFAPVDPDTPTQRGDGGALARFINKSTELPSANSTFGASDYDFMALTDTTLVYTLGGGKFKSGQPYSPTYRDLILLAVSSAKSQEAASTGSSMWEARLIHSVNVFAKGRNSFNDNSLPTYDYTMVANYVTTLPWGTAFAAGTHGDTQFVYSDFTWPYRPILERYTGDGSETTFNLTKNIAEDSSDNIIAYVAGSAITWVTGVPSAGEFGITESTTDTIVFGTAPGSSEKVVILYGWS